MLQTVSIRPAPSHHPVVAPAEVSEFRRRGMALMLFVLFLVPTTTLGVVAAASVALKVAIGIAGFTLLGIAFAKMQGHMLSK